MDIAKVLPAECIARIISLTSPKDASRSALVSSAFQRAADSDDVWESFLPSDYEEIIDQSALPTLILLRKKQIFFHLCDHLLLFANGIMSFALEKENGKKCIMVAAERLEFLWVDKPRRWKWISMPESRFAQVAELKLKRWFKVKGTLETKLLSPKTAYAVVFVFKFRIYDQRRFHPQVVAKKFTNLSVNCEGSLDRSYKRMILDPQDDGVRQRGDGWMEVEMGEFFNEDGKNGSVEFRLWDFDDYVSKSGIIVEGIEFRPKSTG